MAALAALWGASYLFIKVALDDLSPVALVFVRCALGALVLIPVALRRGAFAAARAHLGTLALIAAVQIGGAFLLIAARGEAIPSSLAGILVASAPIWTAILAAAFVPEERLPPLGLAGVAVGILGVALLLGLALGGGGALLGGPPGRPPAARPGPRRVPRAPGRRADPARQPRLRDRRARRQAAPDRRARRRPGGEHHVAQRAVPRPVPALRGAVARARPRHDRVARRPRPRWHRRRLPHLLHPQRRRRPEPRVDRRLHRARFLGRLRRHAARRVLHARHRRGPAAHPRGLVGGRRRPPRGQPKRTFPFDRARSCARSMRSSRLEAARKSRSTSRRRAFSERSSSRPCLASRPKSTVAAIA